MNVSSGGAPEAMIRLPSVEVLAVVPAGGSVPPVPPATLADVVVPILSEGQIVDWALLTGFLFEVGVVDEFLAWRREWSDTFAVGSLSNIRALLGAARRLGRELDPPLQALHDQLTLTEYNDVIFAPQPYADFAGTLVELRAALHRADGVVAVALIDEMRSHRCGRAVMRRWARSAVDVVLCADEHVAVELREAGIVVRHGTHRRSEFVDVRLADLTGDVVVLTDGAGRTVDLVPAQARPLGWLVPTSLRWSVQRIDVDEVWGPMLTAIANAIALARVSGSIVRWTTDLTAR